MYRNDRHQCGDRKRTALNLAIRLALGLGVSSGAPAADDVDRPPQPQTSGALQEIVVTAEFRNTNLQQTPIAITALTGSMLQDRGQTDITQVTNEAPNVILTPVSANYGPGVAAFIRGTGQNDNSFALEPGVGMYIDDVYYATILGTDFDLADIQRIEILRGPQGTLAGKNSIGGAIRLISSKPSDEADAYVQGTAGSLNRHDFQGATNITLISDTLYGRISGVSKSQNGYVKIIDYACSHSGSGLPSQQLDSNSNCDLGTEGGTHTQAARAQLRWIGSDQLEVNLSGDVTDDRSDSSVNVLRYVQPGNYTLPNGTPVDSRFYPTSSNPYVSYASFCASPEANASVTSSYCVPNQVRFKARGGSMTADWAPLRNLSFKSITAYRDYDAGWGDDSSDTPYDAGIAYYHDTFHQLSQEFRVSGSLPKVLDWTAGVYYFHGKGIIGGRQQLATVAPPLGPVDFVFHDPVNSSDKAGFVNLDWHITQSLSLDLGYRYTRSTKDYTFYRRSASDPSVVPLLFALPGETPIDGLHSDYDGSHSDYMASLNYNFTPGVIGYAKFSTGFRGGGINPRPLASNQAVPFQPETVKAYELGLKTQFFEDRLRVNAAVFDNEYKDILLTQSSPYYNPALPTGPFNPSPSVLTLVEVNGGNARFEGAELEMELHAGGGLSVDGSLSYLNFHFTSIGASLLPTSHGGLCTSACYTVSDPWIYDPKWKASVGAQWQFNLPGGSSLTPRIDASFTSEYNTTTARPLTTYSFVPSYTLTNAHLIWMAASGDWQTNLGVTNLTNRVYFTNAFDSTSNDGIARGELARPREWEFTIRRSFK
jgi:iron complex outermembrane receptor protein